MDRREYLAAAGLAGAAALSGCSALQSASGSPDVEWEWETRGFVGAGMTPTVFVTGSVENVGDGRAGELELTASLLREDGTTIDDRMKPIRSIAPNEEQMFYYRFVLDAAEVDAFDEAEVTGELVE